MKSAVLLIFNGFVQVEIFSVKIFEVNDIHTFAKKAISMLKSFRTQ